MNASAGDFLLPVDKPEGPTSHDLVVAARRALGTRRIGHTGTLDPFASGLMILCVGRATRLAEYLSGLDKTYEAVARLGIATDTLDREGEVVRESDAWKDVTRTDIEAALAAMCGEVSQMPPQFSAKKVGGESMHRKARRGESVELARVGVTVHAVDVVSIEIPHVRFNVHCSSGTYIRAMARDLGDALGVGAHLTALRRTGVGRFGVDEAIDAGALGESAAVAAALIEPVDALTHLSAVEIDEAGARRLANGQRIRWDEMKPGTAIGGNPRVLVSVVRGRDLLAIAEVEAGVLKPRKVFTT